MLATASFALGAQDKETAGIPPILDPQAQLDRFTFWDNRDWDWYKANIPFFESPDPEIDRTYYYRWELVTKHMTYGSPDSGYSFKEFIRAMHWSGAYGAISCPLALQIGELRWLKNRRVTDDFIRYWFHTPGAQPRSYSNWFSTAVWDNYLVNGDKNFVIAQLPDMEAQYAGWSKERWDPQKQMFHWSGTHDGMERNIASRQTPKLIDGAEVYLNGVKAGSSNRASDHYVRIPVDPAARATLHPGENIIAAHAYDTLGACGLDVGVTESKAPSTGTSATP